MRTILLLALLPALATPAAAQQVMDESDKSVPAGIIKIIKDGLIPTTPDPFASQIIKLHESVRKPGDFCGLINLKNRNGGYEGFEPFMISSGRVFLAKQGGGNCM